MKQIMYDILFLRMFSVNQKLDLTVIYTGLESIQNRRMIMYSPELEEKVMELPINTIVTTGVVVVIVIWVMGSFSSRGIPEHMFVYQLT